MTNLSGKIALVTGAGPNIGREIARTLANAGALVLCNDVIEERAEETADYLKSQGLQGAALPGDISNPEQVNDMIKTAADKYGPIDILVNNAAVTIPRSILSCTFEEWTKVQQVILNGTFLMSQAVANLMIDNGRKGSIVNIASTSGHRGRANAVAYCTAKGGILNMTRAMAVDLAKYGIRVNSVSPTKSGNSVGSLEKVAMRSFDEILLGRMGEPQDQANAVLFLVSDQSSFITGMDIRVDGGTLATWGTRSHADPTLTKIM